MTIALIIAALLIGIIEGVYLVKKRMVKELIAAEIILIIAIVLQIASGWEITLLGLLRGFLEPIGRMFFKNL
jgi:hypothetical protein